jgi:hypothetical protein
MADNLTAPAAGAVLASDDIGGVQYPRMKVTFGADGSSTDVSTASPLPVTLGLTDTQLRASPLDVNVTFPTEQAVSIADPVAVTGEFYPATQPISGSVGITGNVAVTGPLTDNELRASPLEVDVQNDIATSAKQDEGTAAVAKLGSAKRWFPITPDGNTDLATIPDAIYVGGAGDVVLKGSDGTNATFAVTAGQVLPFSPTRVLATGTTATGLVGLVS